MKILVVSDMYPPFYKGGHELRCKIIAEGFIGNGHDVHILTSNQGEVFNDDDFVYRKLILLNSVNRCRIDRINKISNALIYATKSRINYFITYFQVKAIKPDIVYVGQLSGISLFPIKAIQRLKIPIVHHVGNYFLVEVIDRCINEKNIFKMWLRRMFHGFYGLSVVDFNHIIAVSHSVKNRYIKSGVPESNIIVIPPRGVNLEDVISLSKLEDRNTFPVYLIYVGRIVQRKGLINAIHAIDYIVNIKNFNKIKLDIIGEGDEEYLSEVKMLVHNLQLENHIKFKGKLSHESVLKEYYMKHVLLVPSVWEDPNPSVVIEAMSQGVAVVASHVGGIPDRIENGKSGILVEPGDPLALGEAIWGLIENPALLKSICINGINKVRNEFLNEQIIRQILNYMAEIKKYH
jgi:glycosyltransferase involved in cell wall biosynthesis